MLDALNSVVLSELQSFSFHPGGCHLFLLFLVYLPLGDHFRFQGQLYLLCARFENEIQKNWSCRAFGASEKNLRGGLCLPTEDVQESRAPDFRQIYFYKKEH